MNKTTLLDLFNLWWGFRARDADNGGVTHRSSGVGQILGDVVVLEDDEDDAGIHCESA